MSTVNYNDTVPAAPANYNNIKWQSDASGNISAYDPGGAWTTWTPTVSPVGSMTVSSVNIQLAEYLRQGPKAEFHAMISFVLGGTASNQLGIGLPVAPVGTTGRLTVCTGASSSGAAYAANVVFIDPANPFLLCGATGGGNFALGGYTFIVAGSYRCA